MFDSLAIAAIHDELVGFVGGRVQGAVQLDALSIGLELYHRGDHRWLYATADPERAGLWLVDEKLGQAPGLTSPLLLMLRKWVRGAHLTGVAQPAFERVLTLRFELAPRRFELIVEATGRLANLILVDETGLVMDAIKRVPPTINRVRTILPKRPYVGPPPQEKASPVDVDAASLAATLSGRDGAAAVALVGAVRGMSPLAAREAVFRAAGRSDARAAEVDPARLAATVAELVGPMTSDAPWLPSLAVADDGYAAFAPYPLTHLNPYEPADTLSEAAQRFFAARAAVSPRTSTGHAQASLAGEVRNILERERRRMESLERELAGASEAESLRECGELLLAYASQIPPAADRVELHDRSIALDRTLTPVENAKSYFDRYARARDAGRRLPRMVGEAGGRVEYLTEALVHLTLAETPDAVAALRRELLEAGALGAGAASSARGDAGDQAGRNRAGRNRRVQQPTGPLRTTLDGHQILIGRSAAQNEAVLDLASPDDLWLHARGLTGAHVIIRSPAPEESIERTAQLAAYYSEARNSTSVPVDVTERRHVRKIKGGPPGAVTYRNERTLNVVPAGGPTGPAGQPAQRRNR